MQTTLPLTRSLLLLLLPALVFLGGCNTGEALARAKSMAAAAEEKLEIKEEELAKIRAAVDKAEEVAERTGSEEAQRIVADARRVYEEAVQQLPTLRQLAEDSRRTLEAAQKAHDEGGGALGIISALIAGFAPAAAVAIRNYQQAKRQGDRARAEQAAREAAERERERYRTGLNSTARLAQRLKKIAPDDPATREIVAIAEAEQRASGVQDLVDSARKLRD